MANNQCYFPCITFQSIVLGMFSLISRKVQVATVHCVIFTQLLGASLTISLCFSFLLSNIPISTFNDCVICVFVLLWFHYFPKAKSLLHFSIAIRCANICSISHPLNRRHDFPFTILFIALVSQNFFSLSMLLFAVLGGFAIVCGVSKSLEHAVWHRLMGKYCDAFFARKIHMVDHKINNQFRFDDAGKANREEKMKWKKAFKIHMTNRQLFMDAAPNDTWIALTLEITNIFFRFKLLSMSW